MRESDRQLGKPNRLYRDTKANIEALGLGAGDEGCEAYATDTNQFGTFDGAAWNWGGGGSRTRKFLVPALGGRNYTDATDLTHKFLSGVEMPDNKDCVAPGQFAVPEDFVSGLTVTGIVRPHGAGDVYARIRAYYAQCSEDYMVTHSASGTYSAVTVTGDDNNCILQLSLASAAKGDIVSVDFRRDATNVADTVNNQADFPGWIAQYTADS